MPINYDVCTGADAAQDNLVMYNTYVINFYIQTSRKLSRSLN